MTTLAEAIAGLAERIETFDGDPFPPCSDDEREFLRNWADALDKFVWKRIATRVEGKESDLVSAAIESLRDAQADDKSESNETQRKRTNLLELAEMADKLAAHFKQLDVFNGALQMKSEFGPWYYLAALHAREAEALRACAPKHDPSLSVTVTKLKVRGDDLPRDRRLFLQHMSTWMKELFDTWDDAAVVEIANLAYPGADITKDHVINQRDQISKSK